MDVSRITSQQLIRDRLDANYYGTQFLRNEAFLSSCGIPFEPIGALAVKCNCGATPKEVNYDGVGQGLIRTSDVRPNYFAIDKVLRTSELKVRSESNVAALTDDLLYTMSGTIGYAAVIPKTDETFSFSNTIARVRLPKNGPNDPRFIATYFNCKYGYKQSLRLVSGGIQGHVMPNPFKNLLVPIPSFLAQKYVGEKVRQAERLRERARVLERESLDFFHLPDWTGERAGAQRSYRNKPSDLRTARLDATHYDPAHLHLAEILKRRGAVPLSRAASPVKEQWDRRSEEFFYLEIGGIELGSGSVTPTRMHTEDAPSRAQKLVKPWDVLVSTVRPNRKNVTLVSELSPNLPIVASTGFAVLRFPTKEAAVFYQSWLRSDAATQQLMQWNAGGAYPAIDDSVPISILVPVFHDEIVIQHGRQWLLKIVGSKIAVELTIAARLLVEALIEGRVAEAELNEAQEGLERGHGAADRKLLMRLTKNGIDMPGEPPLFSDLDALYHALELVTDTGGQLQEV